MIQNFQNFSFKRIVDPEIKIKNQDARKRWNLIKNIFKSISLLQKRNAKHIINVEQIEDEIESFSSFKSVNLEEYKKKRNHSDLEQLMNDMQRTEAFCQYAERGSKQDIQKIKDLLKSNPRQNMRDISDPCHLINQMNNFGKTPLYLAARQGNFEVVKNLIDLGVNIECDSKIYNNDKQIILQKAIHAAVIWKHQKVVEILLNKHKHSLKDLNECIKFSKNQLITNMLKKNLKELYNVNVFSCFGIFTCQY